MGALEIDALAGGGVGGQRQRLLVVGEGPDRLATALPPDAAIVVFRVRGPKLGFTPLSLPS